MRDYLRFIISLKNDGTDKIEINNSKQLSVLQKGS